MEKKYYTFKLNLLVMNIFAFIIIFIMVYLTNFIDKSVLGNFEANTTLSKIIIFWTLYVLYIILHEIIHGIFYVLGGANPKKVVFGMAIEKSILYCLCKQDISIKAAINSVLAPFIYIGILTYAIGLIFHFPILIVLSIANIAGAAGDLIVYTFISKLNKSSKFSEFDDSTSFAILSSKDLSKTKILGLKYVEARKGLDRKDLKKIKISKTSYIFIIITLLGSLLILLYENGIFS